MPSRRQEKINRVIKEAVSDIILTHLNDPRIEGFVTVTRVDTAPDLKKADVYLSVFSESEPVRRKTFRAIEHATRHIQHLLGQRMTTRFCPHLTLREDDKLKQTLDTLRKIEEVQQEFEDTN